MEVRPSSALAHLSGTRCPARVQEAADALVAKKRAKATLMRDSGLTIYKSAT
jgi:hypothetical protein